jgi:hypothetical protein
MSEKEDEQKTQDEIKAGWDKEKQKVEQAEANYRKALEEKETLAAENTAISEQLQANQLQIAELQEKVKAQAEAKKETDFDPDLVDGNVIKELQQARADRKALLKKVEHLEGKAATYEQTEQQRANQRAEDMAIKKMCEAIESEGEYGPQMRNDAISLAHKLVKQGKEEKPTDGIDGMILMKKCYRQLSEKAEPDESVRTDTGDGGLVTSGKNVKIGTTQEVLADMKENKSWLEEPVGTGEPDIF